MAAQRRKVKKPAEEEEVESLPSDRRAYASKNESLQFRAMPPPLKCSAASIFYKGTASRLGEKVEQSRKEQLEEVADCSECTERIKKTIRP